MTAYPGITKTRVPVRALGLRIRIRMDPNSLKTLNMDTGPDPSVKKHFILEKTLLKTALKNIF
jgi:hypothetical protein